MFCHSLQQTNNLAEQFIGASLVRENFHFSTCSYVAGNNDIAHQLLLFHHH